MAYCTIEEINALLSDISDDASEETLTVVLNNSTAWIDSNLRRNYLPIPTNNPQALNTAAIYYGASDVILTLYHGENMPVKFDVWFNKAQQLLEDYIEAELNNSEDTDTIAKTKNIAIKQRKPYKRRL